MSTKKDDEQLKYEATMREIAFISEQAKQVDLIFAKMFPSMPSMLSIEPVKSVDALQIPANKKTPRIRDKGQRQMNAIIAALESLNYDPLCLPKVISGQSGVKAEARKILDKKGLFTAVTAFENSWQTLTQRGLIAFETKT
jgi:hypothetical protein